MRTLVICGLVRDGGLHADFVRAEVPLAFDAEEKVGEKDTLVFTTQRECMAWCQWQRHWSMSLDSKLPGIFSFHLMYIPADVLRDRYVSPGDGRRI
jgi:hypothetical protein